MSKKITYDESFLDTNLQSNDIVHNTRIDEHFRVYNINSEYEQAQLKSISTNRLLTIDLKDCDDFEIMDTEW